MTESKTNVTLRGKAIREDEFGRWNLNDIWSLANAPRSKEPKHWTGKPSSKRLQEALQKKVTNSYLKENKQIIPVLYAKRGRDSLGTFAHPILAAAYAGYLSPKLEIETREVWLRFRSGDATLADEILQNASPEANEWVAKRAMGRVARNGFTDELSIRGVYKPLDFAKCTNATYQILLNKNAKQIKAERGITTNARDALDIKETVMVALSEVLSVERMQEEGTNGFIECHTATQKAAKAVRSAVDADRQDRQIKTA